MASEGQTESAGRFDRVRDERQEMEERAMQVNEMYDLLDAYEVKIPAVTPLATWHTA